jgi:hypothetical protein
MSQLPHAARLRAAGQPAMRVLCLTEGPDRGARSSAFYRPGTRAGATSRTVIPLHIPHLDKPLPRTAHLESVPVSGLKSRPSQPVPDERERHAPGGKNALQAQSGPAPRTPRASRRHEGRGTGMRGDFRGDGGQAWRAPWHRQASRVHAGGRERGWTQEGVCHHAIALSCRDF